jgi:hypothetical protein
VSERVYSDPYEDPDRVPRALAAAAAIVTAGWNDDDDDEDGR